MSEVPQGKANSGRGPGCQGGEERFLQPCPPSLFTCSRWSKGEERQNREIMVGRNVVVCQASSPCPWEGCLVPVGGMQVVEPDQGIKIAGVVPEMGTRVWTLYHQRQQHTYGLRR